MVRRRAAVDKGGVLPRAGGACAAGLAAVRGGAHADLAFTGSVGAMAPAVPHLLCAGIRVPKPRRRRGPPARKSGKGRFAPRRARARVEALEVKHRLARALEGLRLERLAVPLGVAHVAKGVQGAAAVAAEALDYTGQQLQPPDALGCCRLDALALAPIRAPQGRDAPVRVCKAADRGS
ncbi:hypothetical protein M885DRAFT_547940 [Pelagophyceae sp. CCMP2097]|nr:hypothetical protein M885DRAFT_547940 [Pelagophyceae sp. CCMP2097]